MDQVAVHATSDKEPRMNDQPIRLTSLAHGGGCGCKLAPAVLQDILAGMPMAAQFPNLLVGTETGDDAAVWRLNDDQALVATTDFFMPVVDDPFDFGRIAATNALSDIYAMGGKPIMALAIVGMPISKMEPDEIQRILAGGASVCAAAGIPIAGGHSIDSLEPIYGLVALGLVHPDRLMRNSSGRAGDVLVLSKGLGIGIFSAAMKQDALSAADYATMIASTTRLNDVKDALTPQNGVHAVTDVTGFALIGHVLEMCRGASLAATLNMDGIPVLAGAAKLAAAGMRTGAGERNWASYSDAVHLPPALPEWQKALLCDPQTSGGLLIAVAPDKAEDLLTTLHRAGHKDAARIGTLHAGAPEVRII
jgi:selenide,water dikinase